jgi:hypothetical protein
MHAQKHGRYQHLTRCCQKSEPGEVQEMDMNRVRRKGSSQGQKEAEEGRQAGNCCELGTGQESS